MRKFFISVASVTTGYQVGNALVPDFLVPSEFFNVSSEQGTKMLDQEATLRSLEQWLVQNKALYENNDSFNFQLVLLYSAISSLDKVLLKLIWCEHNNGPHAWLVEQLYQDDPNEFSVFEQTLSVIQEWSGDDASEFVTDKDKMKSKVSKQ